MSLEHWENPKRIELLHLLLQLLFLNIQMIYQRYVGGSSVYFQVKRADL